MTRDSTQEEKSYCSLVHTKRQMSHKVRARFDDVAQTVHDVAQTVRFEMHDKRLMSHKVNARFEVLVHSKRLRCWCTVKDRCSTVPTPFQVHNKRPLFHKVHTPFEVHSERLLFHKVHTPGRCPVLWAGPQGAVPCCGPVRRALSRVVGRSAGRCPELWRFPRDVTAVNTRHSS